MVGGKASRQVRERPTNLSNYARRPLNYWPPLEVVQGVRLDEKSSYAILMLLTAGVGEDVDFRKQPERLDWKTGGIWRSFLSLLPSTSAPGVIT